MAANVMSNVTQYQFELREVARLLLKKQGISEGLWTIGMNFGLAPVLAGPEPGKERPSMLVSVDKILLTRANEAGPMTVDASEPLDSN